jgi:hypothetical protein
MEQNNPDILSELQVDHETRSHFKEASKWSNFIAVISFICFGLLALVLLLAGPFMFSQNYPSDFEGPKMEQGSPAFRIAQMLLMTVFLLYAGIMLLRFASACRRGVEMQDQQSLNYGLRALRNFFIALGCFSILGIVRDAFVIINTF